MTIFTDNILNIVKWRSVNYVSHFENNVMKRTLWDPNNTSYMGYRLYENNIAVDWKEIPEAHIFEVDILGLSK